MVVSAYLLLLERGKEDGGVRCRRNAVAWRETVAKGMQKPHNKKCRNYAGSVCENNTKCTLSDTGSDYFRLVDWLFTV